MRIVCFTEIEEGREYGLFLATCNRLIAMQKMGHEIELYALRKYHSGWWANIRKFLKLTVKTKSPVQSFSYKSLTCNYLFYPEGMFGYLLEKAGHPDYTLRKIHKLYNDNQNVDFIIAHWGLEPAYGAMMLAKKMNTPLVVYYHGSDINYTPGCWVKAQSKILRNACCNIFVSNALLSKARTKYAQIANPFVSHNGLEVHIEEQMNHIRSKQTILFAGSLELVKGADLLPDIARKVYEKNNTAEFVIIGSGNLSQGIRKELSEAQIRFQMPGKEQQTEVIARMQKAAMLIVPSRNEGLPTVILEGIQTNTPIVATHLNAISEMLEDDYLIPEIGIVSRSEYISLFAGKVIKMIDQPIANYRYRVKSWDEVVSKEIEQIYESKAYLFRNNSGI